MIFWGAFAEERFHIHFDNYAIGKNKWTKEEEDERREEEREILEM